MSVWNSKVKLAKNVSFHEINPAMDKDLESNVCLGASADFFQVQEDEIQDVQSMNDRSMCDVCWTMIMRI